MPKNMLYLTILLMVCAIGYDVWDTYRNVPADEDDITNVNEDDLVSWPDEYNADDEDEEPVAPTA